MSTNELLEFFRPPIPEIMEAADSLGLAADAHLKGDSAIAHELFAATNTSTLRQWTESVWGKGAIGTKRYRSIPGAAPYVPKGQRPTARMPNNSEKRIVIERDGFVCRFCGIPVIDASVRTLFAKIYPEVVPWGRRNEQQHAAFQLLWLQYDHIVPHCRGGDNSPDNIVVTCAPCNYGRGNWLLEEVGLADPRLRSPVRRDWDGLMRVFGIPKASRVH